MACDMSEPYKFPSLDSCLKKFLWTHKKGDLASHPITGLVLQVGDAEKFFSGIRFRKPGSFFQSHQAGSMFFSYGGGWR